MDIAREIFSKVKKRLKDGNITQTTAFGLLSDFRKNGTMPEFMKDWELDEEDDKNGQ